MNSSPSSLSRRLKSYTFMVLSLFLYWLRRTGYAGYMTLDQFPFREDGRNAVAESAQWLDYLESLVDQADFQEIESVLAQKDAVESSRLMRRLLRGRPEAIAVR